MQKAYAQKIEGDAFSAARPRAAAMSSSRVAKARWVFDEHGKKYLDLGSAQGVAMLGHCHPGVTAAIQAQAETLTLCPNYLYNDKRAEFAQALVDVLPKHLPHVFLANSGAEADGRRAQVRAAVHQARRRLSRRPRDFTAGRWARCR